MKQITKANGKKEVLITMDKDEANKVLVFTTEDEEDNQNDIQDDDIKKEDANENQDEEDMEHSYKEAHTNYGKTKTVTIIWRIQLKPILMIILNT